MWIGVYIPQLQNIKLSNTYTFVVVGCAFSMFTNIQNTSFIESCSTQKFKETRKSNVRCICYHVRLWAGIRNNKHAKRWNTAKIIWPWFISHLYLFRIDLSIEEKKWVCHLPKPIAILILFIHSGHSHSRIHKHIHTIRTTCRSNQQKF